MKIECPECKLSGNLDEAVIPATGIALNCPRCKARFVVERPQAGHGEGVAMLDSCPSCQFATFSEEKFSVCPKCGLVVAEYHRQQRRASGIARKTPDVPPAMTPEELRRDEESRKKYGLEEPAAEDKTGAASVFGASGAPVPLLVTGWGTIAVAVALAVYGVSGFMEYRAKLSEAEAVLQAGEQALSGFSLFWRFGLIPLLMVGYAAVMAVVANRFLCLQSRAIRWLETGGWAGVILGALTELVDLAAWCARASENATIGYYATGVFGGALMALLWMAPPFVLVEYLRSEQFDRLGSHFR